MLRGAALQMFRGVPVRAFGVHVSMARRARLCSFPHGCSENFALFPVVRAAAMWQRCMRNACAPSRSQVSGNCSTWIHVTTCSSCRHMLRGAAYRFAALTLFGALIPPSRNYCLSLLSPSPPRSFRPPIHSFARPLIHLLVHQFLHSSPIRTSACQSIHLSTRSSSHSCMNESFIRSFLCPSPPPFPTFLCPLPSLLPSPLRAVLASSLHRVCLSSHRAICSCLIFGPNCRFFGTNLRLCTMKNALSSLAIDRELGFC